MANAKDEELATINRQQHAMTRDDLIVIAKTTDDAGKAQWCRTFAANLEMLASDDEEERVRGARTIKQNVDWCERLFLRR